MRKLGTKCANDSFFVIQDNLAIRMMEAEEAALWAELPADLYQGFEIFSKAFIEWSRTPEDERNFSAERILRLPAELLIREVELVARLLGRYDPVITGIDFTYRQINTHASTLLARGLVRNHSLRRLSLVGNQIGDEGVRALVSSLVHSNTALEELDVGSNNLTALSGSLLGILLTHHRGRLTTLRLSSNTLGVAGATALAQALNADSSLTELRIAQNGLGPDIANFANVLGASGSSLEALYLAGNGLGEAGIASLLGSLQSYASLMTLDISWNGLGVEGAHSVASYLAHGGSVRTLFLNFNQFYRDSIAEIIGAAFFSPNLTRLEVIGHDIYDGRSLFLALSELLQRNFVNRELRSLTLLDLLLSLS